MARKDQDVSLWHKNILKETSLGVDHLQCIPMNSIHAAKQQPSGLHAVTSTCSRRSVVIGDDQVFVVPHVYQERAS